MAGGVLFMDDQIFKKIESKTNIKKDDILRLANSIQNKNLNDEANLRQLIHDVSRMANKEISKDKEDKLVETIKGNLKNNNFNL